MQNMTFSIWTSVIYIFIALLIQLLFSEKGIGKFLSRYASTLTLFRKAFVFSVWVLVLSFVAEQGLTFINNTSMIVVINPLKTCLLIVAFAFGTQSYKAHFIKNYVKKNPLNQDANVINGIDKLLSIAIFMIAILLILDTLGFKSGPLLAFGGVGAAALGFAAKDVISNFFGGFMLVISRPFTHGDLILIPERNIEAHVIYVGWYMTTLKDRSKRLIYLPNSAFVSAYIINSSRRSHRKIDSSLCVKAADKPRATLALNRVRGLLDTYPGLDHSLHPYASLESCEYGFFEIKLSAFTEIREEREFYEYREKLLLTLCETLTSSGMELQGSPFIIPSLPR